jgi:DNA-binding response OmpR family regulator
MCTTWSRSSGCARSSSRAFGNVAVVPTVLLATDADWIRDEVDSAIGDEQTTVTVVQTGVEVIRAVADLKPDLVVLDLQIGNMGGMAVCMALRLEESGGRLPHVRVLMLLDRSADVFLAQRSGAEGWLIKPLDSFRLRRAANALLAGGRYVEGIPSESVAEAL